MRPFFILFDMITVEQARHHYPPSKGTAHGFDHVLRVLALAEEIARAEGADPEIVRVASLLHDVTAEGTERSTHHISGAEKAREILLELGHPADRVQAVVHCIRMHRYRGSEATDAPFSLEAQCLFDADKLDAIGAVGVARAFVYGAELDQPMWGQVSAEFKAGAETGEVHTAHHEFFFKLRRISERLYTQTGRRMAVERHRYMVEFFERMAREVEGKA
jgi:uncharacterized protein